MLDNICSENWLNLLETSISCIELHLDISWRCRLFYRTLRWIPLCKKNSETWFPIYHCMVLFDSSYKLLTSIEVSSRLIYEIETVSNTPWGSSMYRSNSETAIERLIASIWGWFWQHHQEITIGSLKQICKTPSGSEWEFDTYEDVHKQGPLPLAFIGLSRQGHTSNP